MATKDNMNTAITLAHVAALLQIIFTILGFIAVLGISVLVSGPAIIGSAIGIVGVVIGVAWSWADYELIYEPMKAGRYSKMSDRMLIIGLIQLFVGGTVPGVIILVSWLVARS